MKKGLVLVLIMAMMMFGGTADARLVQFNEFAGFGFSVVIPDEWTVTEDELYGTIAVSSPYGEETITFVTAHRESFEPFTFALANSGMEQPVQAANGDFEFVITDEEEDAQISVRTRHMGNLGIVMRSEHGSFDNILSILDTLIH